MLKQWQFGFIVEDFIENHGRVAHRRRNHLRAELRILI
jgi:hypothetical protein